MSIMARHLLLPVTRLGGFFASSGVARCQQLLHTRPFQVSPLLSNHRCCRIVSSDSSSFTTASSPSTSSPSLTVYSLQLPQLSPSMSHGTITAFHVQPGTTVTPASLVFTLTTSTLLAPSTTQPPTQPPPAASAVSSHTMLVESHDPGVVGWLDEAVVDSGRELPVGQLLGWMWEDDEDRRKGAGRESEVHRLVQQAAKAAGAEGGSGGAREVDGIRVKPFVWQAYVAEGEQQEGECAPTRKE